jgi:hypothetical protein
VNPSGGGPWAFLTTRSGGNAGGVTLSEFSLHVAGTQQGGEHEGPAGDAAATAAEISIWPKPWPSGEVESRARGAIAREELITVAASATTETVPIASVVARFIEPFISLWRYRVKSKKRRICRVKHWEIIADRLRLE